MGDTTGKLFRATTFGESHGPAVGVVIDGCPAGLEISLEEIQAQLDRRRPGQSRLSTQRKEGDQARILSGWLEGRTTGTALAIVVENAGQRSGDYEEMAQLYRPSHADYTYDAKYGFRDHRGGGRASARETIGRVAAGAVAAKLLAQFGVATQAWVAQVGTIHPDIDPNRVTPEAVEANPVRCPDPAAAERMAEAIEQARRQGDSLGGVVELWVKGCPPGLGEPVFDKLTADLAKGLMSIPASRGVEFGLGFAAAALKGSEHNDAFVALEGAISTATNRSGGIQGGISNGMPISARVAFKPTATISQPQQTVNRQGQAAELRARGRHDPCVLPRAVPIVEAMANLVLADHLLRQAVKKNIPALTRLIREG